jgi:hypothetical protein
MTNVSQCAVFFPTLFDIVVNKHIEQMIGTPFSGPYRMVSVFLTDVSGTVLDSIDPSFKAKVSGSDIDTFEFLNIIYHKVIKETCDYVYHVRIRNEDGSLKHGAKLSTTLVALYANEIRGMTTSGAENYSDADVVRVFFENMDEYIILDFLEDYQSSMQNEFKEKMGH